MIGAIVTVPVAGFAVLPGFLGQKHHPVDLGPVKDFAEGQWYIATFLLDPSEGVTSRRTAFVRNNGSVKSDTARRAELHDHLQPVRPPRLPGAGERPDGQDDAPRRR